MDELYVSGINEAATVTRINRIEVIAVVDEFNRDGELVGQKPTSPFSFYRGNGDVWVQLDELLRNLETSNEQRLEQK